MPTAMSPRIAICIWHVVEGDVQSADKLQDFYDEYLSVMDLSGGILFANGGTCVHQAGLAKGTYHYRGELITPACHYSNGIADH